MSKGTNGWPVPAARGRRESSNISFPAAAWTVAVLVRTPSRSNRPARMPSGRPSTAVAYPKTPGARQERWARPPASAAVLLRQAGGDEAVLVGQAAGVE